MHLKNNLYNKKSFKLVLILIFIISTYLFSSNKFSIYYSKKHTTFQDTTLKSTSISQNKLNDNKIVKTKIINNSPKHLKSNGKTNKVNVKTQHCLSKNNIKLSRSCATINLNTIKSLNPHLPRNFKYRPINTDNLKSFLCKRGSLLAEEPYFTTIISTARDFNLNPLVMFAITGQEQSFVPKDNKYANKIANNPFNVFNSWQKYNTNIKDSSEIASRTIVNLSKNRPSNIDPFIWINKSYCSDKTWGENVRKIYNQLESKVLYSEE